MNGTLPINHLDQGRKTEERNRENDNTIRASIFRRNENLYRLILYYQ